MVAVQNRSTSAMLGLALALSLLAHAAALWLLEARPSEPALTNKPVELVMVEIEPPKPPPPPPPPEEKKVELPRPKVRPPVRAEPPVKPPPEPPKEEAPPPPNDAPPPEPSAKPPPLVVGISMSSTTSAGSFAAPVGNTLYGKTAEKAVSPEEVRAYSASRYVPIYQVDAEPTVAHEVKVPYPDEARRAGIEGQVVLSLRIDEQGNVVSAKVLSGPGYGLNEAALEAIRRFKFTPAVKGGAPVETEMKYTYTFLLD